ncbi:ArsR/SmtB family transcription factor [Pseudidiomarina terrestris]|uniref:Winged helix-turn-helix transcriptional regulator n=1 Tax=Pseudidiomarina terrestris TaxID=2820060 RepID=A0AAW7QZM4_9GAMM|nr:MULTISPECIES: metalloregulator ArsR/SmtB family transcription factor [unclassified Pseudidiomarina]MDN7125675.1 winged helix-turn-helix transcriptional regulator [Pseudidiomarina sp. 1APP75-32.1]MDN7128124.1 winged helix-turn-helix transcriptional regulator [Pseudidiomarina sp. 1APR75-33.1]MDN7130678.1 winged helix-turn-helix transcriptional regulator [Pseudidiomarina sp. 1APR75-15]MDN7136593.1 winged helix-turn-helix transcriptional regulator [Pseudidiomarina sp. 1ASP75-5]MDN7138893.1 wing
MTTQTIEEMQQDEAQNAATFLRSIANEHRLQILCHLASGEQSVGELNRHFPLSASAFSQHLAVLRQQELVKFRKEAQTIYYSIKDQDTLKFMQLLKTKFCPDY